MSPRDMLAKLQAAGLPVKAVASAVDEQAALDALAGKKVKKNGASGNGQQQQPAAPRSNASGPIRAFGSGSGPAQRISRANQPKDAPGQGGAGKGGPGGPGNRQGGPGQRGPGGPGGNR